MVFTSFVVGWILTPQFHTSHYHCLAVVVGYRDVKERHGLYLCKQAVTSPFLYGKPINKFILVLSWISWLKMSFISLLVGFFLSYGFKGCVSFWGLIVGFSMAFEPEFKCNGM